jgi:hypothetical protein
VSAASKITLRSVTKVLRQLTAVTPGCDLINR